MSVNGEKKAKDRARGEMKGGKKRKKQWRPIEREREGEREREKGRGRKGEGERGEKKEKEFRREQSDRKELCDAGVLEPNGSEMGKGRRARVERKKEEAEKDIRFG